MITNTSSGLPLSLSGESQPQANVTNRLRSGGPRPARLFQNPLAINDQQTGEVVSCPDPAIIDETQAGVRHWYLYCTGDPYNSQDIDAQGHLKSHRITMFHSTDLMNWTSLGDAFPQPLSWVPAGTALWAPAVKYFNNRFYLYFVAPETSAPLHGYAIGVATSDSPAGPWVDSGQPAVPPMDAPCCPGTPRWVIDPDVIAADDGQLWLTFGSYVGGVAARKLSADGLRSDASSEVPIALDNRYEGVTIIRHGGYFYLLASAANCCAGPLTGYSVFAARSISITGPYVDAQGISTLDPRVGGTPVVSANGNRWIGPGGGVLFQDAAGQDYLLYHAVDRGAPYFDGNVGFTRRPALIDPVDWIDGWPVVRGGAGPSDMPIPAPVAQTGGSNGYRGDLAPAARPDELLTAYSDEFNAASLGAQWQFVHPLADNSYQMTGNAYQVQTHGPDLNGDAAHVSVLAEAAPQGAYMVETRVRTNIPPGPACCYNYAQAALLIFSDDQNSVKLDVFADWETRQVEFGKQVGPVTSGYPTYGNSVLTAPGGPDTWLRVVAEPHDWYEQYTAYASIDGAHWYKGSTWTHTLGANAKIGLAAQNAAGFTVEFDYVRVSRVRYEPKRGVRLQ